MKCSMGCTNAKEEGTKPKPLDNPGTVAKIRKGVRKKGMRADVLAYNLQQNADHETSLAMSSIRQRKLGRSDNQSGYGGGAKV